MSDRKPRVLFVTPVLEYPPHGGPWLRIYNTILALSRAASLSIYSLRPQEAIGGEVSHRHLLTLAEGIHYPRPLPPRQRDPVRRAARRALKPVRHWQDIFDIARLVRDGRFDVIWVGYGNISYDLLILKLLTGKPVVIDTDSVWSRFIFREAAVHRSPLRRLTLLLSGLWKRSQEIVGTNLADLTIAVSDVDRAYYRGLDLLGQPVMLLANVIDVDGYAGPVAAPQGFVKPAVCMTGSMHSAANIDAATWLTDEILPRVWAKCPELRAYIIGKRPPEFLRARGTERVIITGEVDSSLPYLRNADVAVVPLRFESGTRFKILEAFACGTPVVSTTLGAEGLAVEHGKHLLLADSPTAIAQAILRLLADAELCGRLTAAGHAFVDTHNSIPAAEQQVRAALAQLRRDHW